MTEEKAVNFESMDNGLESTPQTIFSLPQLKVIQSPNQLPAEGADERLQLGTYMNDATKEYLGKKVTLHVFRCWKSRAKFPPRSDGKFTPECTCPQDGPRAVGTLYGKCRQCQYYNFQSPDHCLLQFNLVVSIGDDTTNLYRLILSKTSYKSGRTFEKEMSAKVSAEKHMPFEYEVILKNKVSKGTFRYYTNELEITDKLIDPKDMVKFEDAFARVKKLREESLKYHDTLVAEENAAAADAPHFNCPEPEDGEPDTQVVDTTDGAPF